MEFRPPPLPEIATEVPRGNVLCIAPHPDDEFIGPGGTLIRHARQGDAIRLVYVCSGINGDPDGHFDREIYPALRQEESRSAAGRWLRTEDLHFYGHPDSLDTVGLDRTFGDLPADPDEKRRVLIEGLAQNLGRHVREHRPRTVYYPWVGECHPDHWAVGMAVTLLVEHEPALFRDASVLGYEVWTTLRPQMLVDTTSTHAEKLAAIRTFKTQMRYRDYALLVGGLNAHRAALSEDPAIAFAEAFVGCYLREDVR